MWYIKIGNVTFSNRRNAFVKCLTFLEHLQSLCNRRHSAENLHYLLLWLFDTNEHSLYTSFSEYPRNECFWKIRIREDYWTFDIYESPGNLSKDLGSILLDACSVLYVFVNCGTQRGRVCALRLVTWFRSGFLSRPVSWFLSSGVFHLCLRTSTSVSWVSVKV